MHRLSTFLLFNVLACLGQNVQGSYIIHGKKAPANSMQYMVSLQNKWGHHVCGGFMVRGDIVVTAAHCAEERPVRVVLGTHKLSESYMSLDIEYFCKFPTYKSVGFGADIMLLKLSGEVTLSNRVKIIPLPTSSNANLRDGQICSVAGWGQNGTHHPIVDDLRVVNVSILDPQLCREKWGGLPPNVICAGGYNTDKGFCQGDSGGPLVCDGVAVGVVSFNNGKNCDYPDVPNVYTDISKYLEWINSIIKTNKCV
uniref:Duodenase-1-like n=1 Tax=Poecilia reticulata TaxID=8081 RepID=A0A3P9NPH1_POERE